MNKRILIFLVLLFLLTFFTSCRKEVKNKILVTSEGKFFITNENGRILKRFEENFNGKCLISEIKDEKILFLISIPMT